MNWHVTTWQVPTHTWQFLLAALSLFLDSRQVLLPVVGGFSTGFVPLMVLMLHSEPSIGLIIFTLVAGIVLRCLLDNRANTVVAFSIVPELMATGACVALFKLCESRSFPGGLLTSQFLSLGVWVLTQRWISKRILLHVPDARQTAALRVSLAVHEFQIYCLLLCLALLHVTPKPDEWWLAALLCAPLLGLHRALENTIFRLQAQSASSALAQFTSLKKTAEDSRNKSLQREQALQQTRAEKQLIENLHSHLSSESNLQSAYQYTLEVAKTFIRAESLAIFERSDLNDIFERCCSGPYQQNFGHAKLLQLYEPIVEECFLESSVRYGQPVGGHRIFSEESAAVAIPLGRYAVLYAGRRSGAYDEIETQSLQWLCSKAGISLQLLYEKLLETARRQDTVRVAQQLTGRVSLLSELLECSQHLSASLDWSTIAGHFQYRLPRLVAVQAASVVDAAGNALIRGSGLPPLSDFNNSNQKNDVAILVGSAQEVTACVQLKNSQSYLLLQRQGSFTIDELQAVSLFANILDLSISNIQYVQKVVDTQKCLLQSSKLTAVGQLAAGVAHEFNSPFGSIRLAIESVTRSPEGGPWAKKMDRAMRALERCQNIVDKLTIFTKIGDEPIETLDLTELAKDTLSFFHSHLKLEECSVTCDFPAPVLVQCRVRDLQQVLLNVLLNAVESYGENRSTDRKIVLSSGVDEFGWLCIEDEGCGITDQDLERVFEPFFTNKVIGKNTGLGLTVARELVESHSGKIQVDSQPGAGTRVKISLPGAQ